MDKIDMDKIDMYKIDMDKIDMDRIDDKDQCLIPGFKTQKL